jgi:organic radical activating enzyme
MAEAAKYILGITRDGKELNLAVEDVVGRQLNRFLGWTCNAGVQTLYIDYDGSVWVANCAGSHMNPNFLSKDITKEWGYVGDIFKDNYNWPKGPTICPFSSCGCGADICASKNSQSVKTPSNSVKNINPVTSDTELVSLSMNYHWPKHILWDIGRWCNYSCSYCWDWVHNKTDPHKKLDVMKRVVDQVHDNWSGTEMIRWSFGGGEPTVNPDFLPLVEYIKGRGDYVLTVSNGSRNPEYYAKLARVVDCIQLSVHFEYWKSDNFVLNVDTILKSFKDRGHGWMDVKIMCKPGLVQEGIDWRNTFNSMIDQVAANGRWLGYATCVPIRDKDDGGELVGYSQEEITLLNNG